MIVDPSAITVTSAIDGHVYSGPPPASNTTQTAWQLTLGTSFTYDQLILRIDDALVLGLAGPLDGEWTDNPRSLNETGTHLDVFPSGDNMAGGDFEFFFTVLTGDFNHDNKVDAADYVVWDKNKTVTSGATHSMGDANGDGAVNTTDYDIWRTQWGLNFTVWPT